MILASFFFGGIGMYGILLFRYFSVEDFREIRSPPHWPQIFGDIPNQSRGSNQWISWRENLQDTIDFPMKYGIFL